MPVDVDAAERFVLANARVLERHLLAVLLHGGAVAPVLDALRAFRNPDGGFGHARNPTYARRRASRPRHCTRWRCWPRSERWTIQWSRKPASGSERSPLQTAVCRSSFPRRRRIRTRPGWFPLTAVRFLTFAIAGRLWEAGSSEPWLGHATEWWDLDGARTGHTRCARTYLATTLRLIGTRRDAFGPPLACPHTRVEWRARPLSSVGRAPPW